MRTSKFPLQTQKETPANSEIASHQLMLRAGMIRKLAAGLYTWLPLGLRVLRKVEDIVRKEMNRAGALELLMPAVQPAELWQESGRWEKYGPELLRISDRHGRDFCFGPTHEEIITDIARNELRSYKQLPINFYQIQTKFRDEIRPRFGVMRAREFLMKDAYSFHADSDSLQQTYEQMHQTYCQIFSHCGLEFRAVQADSGSIGGEKSHEFHVLADSGEDAIVFSTESDYAANLELAEAVAPAGERPTPGKKMDKVATPAQRSIEEVRSFLGVDTAQCLKTLIVHGSEEGQLVALTLRGDHELNSIKAEKLPLVAAPIAMATDAEIEAAIGCSVGSIGPLGLTIPVVVDRSAAHVADFVCGANQDGYHLTGVNWGRDLPEPTIMDLRSVEDGDPSPDGQGSLTLVRGIEVGHIFQLGEKYSKSLNASVLDANGAAKTVTMGCYGIGVSRVVAAAIEQSHDESGIIWPTAIAPFHVALLPMKMDKSERVRTAVEELYQQMQDAGIEVLLDDRKVRPGVMFADMELIGIPHRVVIGERSLDEGQVEYRGRQDSDNQMVATDEIVAQLQQQIFN